LLLHRTARRPEARRLRFRRLRLLGLSLAS
jgi:hypothetical protein